MIDPNGSMWGIGFSVRRPARFAVSSPSHSATTPWLSSWRMTATTRHPKRMSASRRGTRSALGRAGDAEPGGRHRLEAGLADRAAAALAAPVGAVVELLERDLDVLERVRQAHRQGVDLAALGR